VDIKGEAAAAGDESRDALLRNVSLSFQRSRRGLGGSGLLIANTCSAC
jgi:hypothetical protein